MLLVHVFSTAGPPRRRDIKGAIQAVQVSMICTQSFLNRDAHKGQRVWQKLQFKAGTVIRRIVKSDMTVREH